MSECNVAVATDGSAGTGAEIRRQAGAALDAAGRTASAATAAGIIGMTRSALALAPLGITADVVAPGPIAGTEMLHAVIPKGSAREKALVNTMPPKTLARARQMARAVRFFADRDNGHVTRQTLYECGGGSIGTLAM